MRKTQRHGLQVVLCAGLVGVSIWQPALASESSTQGRAGLRAKPMEAVFPVQPKQDVRRYDLAAMEQEAAFVEDWTRNQGDTGTETKDGWQFSLGLGVAREARYLGSKEYRTYLNSMLGIAYNWGPFFMDNARGLGFGYQTDGGTSFGAVLNYEPGRKDHDSKRHIGADRLRGMGNISGSPVAEFRLGQQLTPWLSVNGEIGFRLKKRDQASDYFRLGLDTLVYQSGRDVVQVGLNALGGSKRYNQGYFGVNGRQAAASSFSRFDAKSGIYAYSVSVDWARRLDRHWGIIAGVEAMTFTSHIRKSPIVETNNTVSAGVGVVYTF
ncbi:MAG: MipA/OmpV family protein [Lautropia sp.]|nr:MipA/OmpV family protein [Lautropia sp.]